jgi:MYXO-CTERM domain-containing protein
LPEGCGCRMAEEPPGNTAMVWFVLATAGIGWRLGRRYLPKPRRPADED